MRIAGGFFLLTQAYPLLKRPAMTYRSHTFSFFRQTTMGRPIFSAVLAKGLSHISWAEVTSTPCNSELEESHINWAKVTSKYQNPNGTPAFKECCYISKNEENIAHTEVFTYV